MRTPGAVRVLSHHDCDVPPLGAATPPAETRAGLRLIVQPLTPADLPWSIDITSTKVQAMLEGFLRSGIHVNQRLGWRSKGFGVHRRDTLHLKPLNQGSALTRVLFWVWMAGALVCVYSLGLLRFL